MKVTRRLKVTITQHRTLRTTALPVRAFCPACAREVETLAYAQAAEILETSVQLLDSLCTDGLVHMLWTVSGSLRICRDSLFPSGDLS